MIHKYEKYQMRLLAHLHLCDLGMDVHPPSLLSCGKSVPGTDATRFNCLLSYTFSPFPTILACETYIQPT